MALALFLLTAATAAAGIFYFRKRFQKLSGALRRLESANEALQETIRGGQGEKNRAAAILESLAEGVLVVDPRQRVLVANAAISRALGLSRADLEGRHFWEIFRDADLNQMIERTLASRSAAHEEHSMPLSEVVYQIRVSPVFGGEDFLGAAVVFYDVTKLKELEKSRTEFVANVSHELKTPLTSILGFVETLKEGAVDDAENRGRFLSIIETQSMKLHRLIEDLLRLSSVESGARELESKDVDVERLLKTTAEPFDRSIAAKKIVLERRVEPVGMTVRGDAKALEEAVTNLVDNAVKYNRPGGSLRVSARIEDEWGVIEVADTGIGIPESDLPRVFERFYRVDKSRSSETGGSGLGLSIVKHIVERHGGRVTAESSTKSGTVFRIFLPR
jgi:two-component system phosphate regulon sensor histidine kinase PhoR